jgi:N4-(beta-N-acetylglucosaminyl)-L-asparaginase
MRAGRSPQEACEEAVRHLIRVRGEATRGEQVGFLALSASGEVGAFALMSGFTYAVTDRAGGTRVLPAPHL